MTAQDLQSLSPLLTMASGWLMLAGGVGLAAASLVDGLKVFDGGPSRVGFSHVKAAALPFRLALGRCHLDWEQATLARWINGVCADDQKKALKTLIRVGMAPAKAAAVDPATRTCVTAVAAACQLDADSLIDLVQAQASGATLTPAQQAVSTRLDGVLDAKIDAAFERADQQYRNVSKLLAGAVAMVISVVGGLLLAGGGLKLLPASILLGLIAVPLAPAGKDATSLLQSAAGAFKAGKS